MPAGSGAHMVFGARRWSRASDAHEKKTKKQPIRDPLFIGIYPDVYPETRIFKTAAA